MVAPAREASPGIEVGGWGSVPHWGVSGMLFLVSTALLTLEVSLTRLFSFTIWYHFAYLTISVALLGFGASGAIVSSYPRLFGAAGERRIAACLAAAALLTVVALVGLGRHPLEIERLLKEPLRFSLELLAYYLAVGIPFLLGGFAVAVPFAAYPRLMGRLYFWDLLGAALGCALVVRLIEPFAVPGLIVAASGLLLAGAGTLLLGGGSRRAGAGLTAAAALVVALAPAIGRRIEVDATATKNVAVRKEAVARPDAFSRWTALNRVDAFGWEQPSRFSFWGRAGMGRGYAGPQPPSAELYYDGSNGSHVYAFAGSLDDFAMLDHHLLRTPYVVRDRPEVLVIGVGGGIDMLNAVRRGARHVTGVELQPETVTLLKDRLRDFTGRFYERPDVTLVAGEGRHFVRKTRDAFDMIQITAVDTFSAQATGAYVLAESYLYTVEAQEDYRARLRDDGLLSMVIGDIVEPGELPPLATRLALNGYRALERDGARNPEKHIVMIDAPGGIPGGRSCAVLVKMSPFTGAEVRALEAFSDENGFTVLYAPVAHSPHPHQLDDVLGHDEERRRRAIDASWFRIDPVSDDDPFFYNVAKWTHFRRGDSLGSVFPGSFVGQGVLLLMLAQSVVLGLVAIGYPLLRGAGQGLSASGALPYLAYFLTIGVGFMLIEISFVQSFVLFLGSPTHALSVTIFALLLFSSIGSRISSRFLDRWEWALRRLGVAVAMLVVLYALALSRVFSAFLHLDFGSRVLIAVAAQMPMGLALGMFMPLGIARVSEVDHRLVPWAWGVNGLGSVMGSTLAVVLAMSFGFRFVALCAAGLYLLGSFVMIRVGGRAKLDRRVAA